MATASRACFDPEDQYVYDHLEEQYRDLEREAFAAQAAANQALNPEWQAAKDKTGVKYVEYLTLITDELTDDRQSMLTPPQVQLDISGLMAESLDELADKLALVAEAIRVVKQ